MKKRKKMSPEAKENLKNIFGSLISNQRVIDGARHNPWWVAVIMFFLGIILPVVPIFVASVNTYGSQNLATVNMGVDTSITKFLEELNTNNINITVNDNKTINAMEFKSYYDTTTEGCYSSVNNRTGEYSFMAHYVPGTSDEWRNYINNTILKTYYKNGTTDILEADGDMSTAYHPSFLVFGDYNFYLAVYYSSNPVDAKDNKRTAVYTSVNGDYANLDSGYNFSSLFDGMSVGASDNNESVKEVFNRFKLFLDNVYTSIKNKSILTQTLTSLGIYGGLVIFMGLMVFLLTRGKRNIFRVLNLWTCEKISAWSTISPGILALILGFLFKQFAIVLFIILLGTRVMWMSMRQLKPVVQ